MRNLMAIAALIIFSTTAYAGQVLDGVKYNFTGTNWAAVDCNGDGSPINCPLSGEGGNANSGPGPNGPEGESGKH